MDTENETLLDQAVPDVKADLEELLDWVREGGWWDRPYAPAKTKPVPEPVLAELKARIFGTLDRGLATVDPMVAQMKIMLAGAVISAQDLLQGFSDEHPNLSVARNWVAAFLLQEVQKTPSQPWAYEGDDNPIPPSGVGVLLQSWINDQESDCYGLEEPENAWLLTDLEPRETLAFKNDRTVLSRVPVDASANGIGQEGQAAIAAVLDGTASDLPVQTVSILPIDTTVDVPKK